MTHRFHVHGMSCSHCERAIVQALRRVDPAAQVSIDLDTGRVDVTSDRPRERLVQAIADEGYTVTEPA